jgi:DNA-binding CsgD family transcriptional regulator/small-conductance mechanosensitive channel
MGVFIAAWWLIRIQPWEQFFSILNLPLNQVKQMGNFINFVAQNWGNIVIPFIVFAFCMTALLWSWKYALGRLSLWTKEAKWPAEIVMSQPMKLPLYTLCVLLSAYPGLAISAIPGNWKSLAERSLSTMFVFVAVLAVLNVLHGLILFLGKRLDLPGETRKIRTITNIVIITVSVLIVIGIWGVPTAPLLLLVAVASVLILLTLRDAAPAFFAGFMLKTWQHLKVGDQVKLENGEEGRISVIGWSYTQLQTPEGDNLIVPNNQLTRQRVVKVGESPKATEDTETGSILTGRQLEIARLISQGFTNKEIAEKLFISENTVKVHVKNMLKKLEFKNRQQLAVYAILQDGANVEIDTVK